MKMPRNPTKLLATSVFFLISMMVSFEAKAARWCHIMAKCAEFQEFRWELESADAVKCYSEAKDLFDGCLERGVDRKVCSTAANYARRACEQKLCESQIPIPPSPALLGCIIVESAEADDMPDFY